MLGGTPNRWQDNGAWVGFPWCSPATYCSVRYVVAGDDCLGAARKRREPIRSEDKQRAREWFHDDLP